MFCVHRVLSTEFVQMTLSSTATLEQQFYRKKFLDILIYVVVDRQSGQITDLPIVTQLSRAPEKISFNFYLLNVLHSQTTGD